MGPAGRSRPAVVAPPLRAPAGTGTAAGIDILTFQLLITAEQE